MARGYGQFCPVAVAAEVVAERWTPLILREMFCGARRFAELRRGMPLISRSLLAQRLRQLEDAGVIATTPLARGREYRLTEAGQELRDVIERLGEWGQRWTKGRIAAHNLDPGLLLWDVRRRMAVDRLPEARVVVRFDVHGLPARVRAQTSWWFVLRRPEVDLCLKDPGFDVDLVVTADLATFTKVWLGDATMARALREGGVRLDGPRDLVRAFPGWLLLSGFAPVARPRRVLAG
jgi:DNA-binding HxlR family transcriptional regulator